ncbi:MAG: hypothetical protein HYS62_01320 [Candidatus Aenigmarchaeota archaeon]|nr:hypothetical protein [Candidatus Aenigmarchaeota archaeon]
MKRKSGIREMVSNTFTVVARKNLAFFLISLIAFTLLYLFFYGVFTIPVLEIGFFKDVKPGAFDYFYIFSSSLLSALIVTLTKYSITNKVLTRGTSIFGISAGVFGAICPVCLGVNFLVFGSFVTLPLVSLIPYLFWIQLAGLTLLTLGLGATIKNSYDNICLACTTEIKEKKIKTSLLGSTLNPFQSFVFFALLLLAIFALGYQILPLVLGDVFTSTGAAVATNGHDSDLDLETVVSQVLPEEGFTIDAIWEDSVSKMVKAGTLDIDKLNDILTKRYGQPLTEEQKKLLTSDYSNEKLTINSKNAVFMMYVLWALAKDNDNQILHDSPFAQYFEDYDIGVGKAGYGDTKLIDLTPEQQEIAKYAALNSYRPCCGNPTGHPDCSHGFSALGLIELMAEQGYTKEQIFDAFVKFNSYWFPSTYIQDALYFKLAENKDWSDVDRELVAGKQYSSLSGSYAVKQYLQNLGV